MKNYNQIYAIKERYKKEWQKLNPSLTNSSGIYFLTREENGFKYAYIGQAKHILDRLVSHSQGYNQHIDKSLKKHKLYCDTNLTGWRVGCIKVPESELDEKEQEFIKSYANAGYQLLNVTAGGQGAGKFNIALNKPAKTYRDGVSYGRTKTLREIKKLVDNHLVVKAKDTSVRSQNAYNKFCDMINKVDENK